MEEGVEGQRKKEGKENFARQWEGQQHERMEQAETLGMSEQCLIL